MKDEVANEDLISHIKANKNFTFITLSDEGAEEVSSRVFTSERKSEVFIRDAIERAVKCSICNSLLHRNSITIDHIERKEDGGLGGADNGQLAHPYCNTTYKN